MAENLSSWKTLYRFAQFYSLVYVIKTYCFDITQCIGPSMLPTMNIAGDIVLVDRMRRPFKSKYRKGMVVLAKSPTDPHKTVCKRIMAVEGETVLIKWTPYYQTFKRLFELPHQLTDEEGSSLQEKKLNRYDDTLIDLYDTDINTHREMSRSFKIPKGYVWIEGDNPSNSTDSRHFGPIPLNLVTGIVVCKLWPPNEIGLIPRRSS